MSLKLDTNYYLNGLEMNADNLSMISSFAEQSYNKLTLEQWAHLKVQFQLSSKGIKRHKTKLEDPNLKMDEKQQKRFSEVTDRITVTKQALTEIFSTFVPEAAAYLSTVDYLPVDVEQLIKKYN